jgi:hypothetical protein
MQNLTSLSQTSAGNVTCSKNFTVSGSATFSGAVDLTGATVTGMTLSASVVAPDASDGAALGSTSLMWSDLFLASGGVINFNSGNVTLTHSAGTLTMNNLLTLSGNTGVSLTGSAVTKGINLAGATVAMTDADNCLLSFGTWNDEVDIGTQTAHFVPIQVHMHSTTSAAYDIAAARFRVDTDGANTANALGCLQLRQQIGDNIASSAILNASVSVSAAVAVQTGSLLGGYFSIEGSGAITKAGDNDCTPLVAVCNNTGGGVDNVFVAMQNGTGTTVSEIINCVCEHGTATVGLAIEKTANGTAIGTGLKITNATKGIDVSLATIGANGRTMKLDGSAAAPAHADGYGTVEINANFSGTVAGPYACAESCWINFASAAVPGGNIVAVHNDGIYLPTGITASSAKMIIGSRMQYVADDGADPGSLFLFSTNIYANALTAIFDVNAIEDFSNTTTKSGDSIAIPFLKCVNTGTVYYANLYTS